MDMQVIVIVDSNGLSLRDPSDHNALKFFNATLVVILEYAVSFLTRYCRNRLAADK